MLYRNNPKNGKEISGLGFGCMRFPRKGSSPDQEKVNNLIKTAIDRGVNYFDSAYIYPGSEEALGKALETLGAREKVNIATKLPPYLCKSGSDFDKIFNKQLERLRTNYIDYYLIHMLADRNSWERLIGFGILEWIERKKASGQIKNIGFSFHGGRVEFKALLDAYDWNFCMVQYNYLDENSQASVDGVRYAGEKGIPVFVMEPLRGGMLVNGLPKETVDLFAKVDPKKTLAEWSLSWLWNQSQVTMVLSGMNSIDQIENNCAYASKYEANHLDENDLKVYAKAVATINKVIKVPCTGCAYCLPCPQGIDIPTCFAAYNESYSSGFGAGFKSYFMTTGAMSKKQSNASKCVKCKKCEKHCPQKIVISERLVEVSKRLEPFWYAPVFGLARKIMLK